MSKNERKISRRNFIKSVGIASAALLTTASCDSADPDVERKQSNILESEGLLGEHEIVDISRLMDSRVERSGSLDSKTESDPLLYIRVIWKTNSSDPRIVITDIPSNKAIFNLLEDTNEASTVEFLFDNQTLVSGTDSLFYSALNSKNPNEFIEKGLVQATFKLRQSVFDSILKPQSK